MQKEITETGELLTERGDLAEAGWAKQLLLRYDRSKIRASALRIKEWDYYEVINPNYGIVLLIYDIGYQARALVKWMDFESGHMEEDGITQWFTRGSMNLPPSADSGDVSFNKNGVRWVCRRDAVTCTPYSGDLSSSPNEVRPNSSEPAILAALYDRIVLSRFV